MARRKRKQQQATETVPVKLMVVGPREDSRFAVWLTLIFLCAVAVVISRHEMWRDELQSWMIARDSRFIGELLRNSWYERHPLIWYMLLYGLSRFTRAPIAMQAVHVLIAGLTVYIVGRFAPFSRRQKILLAFGYYFFYEYAVISRSYSLGVLLILSVCALFPARRTHLLIISGLLFLLVNTSVYGLIIAVGFCVALVYAYYADRAVGEPWVVSRSAIALSAALVVVGMALSLYRMIGPLDESLKRQLYVLAFERLSKRSNVSEAMVFLLSVRRVLAGVSGSYALLPDMFRQWWNLGRNIPRDPLVENTQAVCGVLLLGWAVLVLVRRRGALVFYGVATVGLLCMNCFVFLSSFLRHLGHLYIVLVVSLWIAQGVELKRRGQDRVRAFGQVFLTGLLVIQVAGGITAGVRDFLYPFSNGRAVAEYIKANRLENLLLVGHMDEAASTVAGYLDCELYYPQSRKFGTFLIWNDKRWAEVSNQEYFNKVFELMEKRKADALLIFNVDAGATGSGIRKLRSFEGAIVGDENFWLYRLDRAHR